MISLYYLHGMKMKTVFGTLVCVALIFIPACSTGPSDKKIRKVAPEKLAEMKKTIEAQVKIGRAHV